MLVSLRTYPAPTSFYGEDSELPRRAWQRCGGSGAASLHIGSGSFLNPLKKGKVASRIDQGVTVRKVIA
jgi:hypothetical protein